MRALLALLLLAGCASGVPVERQVVVPGQRFTAVQGETGFLVRTFLPPESGDRSEVLGAKCTLVSSLYQAEVVTPSRVVVPVFGPQSPELTATCVAGERTGSATAEVRTLWQPSPWGGPGPWGPWGGPWGGPWDGPWGWGPQASVPVFDYPDLFVTLH